MVALNILAGRLADWTWVGENGRRHTEEFGWKRRRTSSSALVISAVRCLFDSEEDTSASQLDMQAWVWGRGW